MACNKRVEYISPSPPISYFVFCKGVCTVLETFLEIKAKDRLTLRTPQDEKSGSSAFSSSGFPVVRVADLRASILSRHELSELKIYTPHHSQRADKSEFKQVSVRSARNGSPPTPWSLKAPDASGLALTELPRDPSLTNCSEYVVNLGLFGLSLLSWSLSPTLLFGLVVSYNTP